MKTDYDPNKAQLLDCRSEPAHIDTLAPSPTQPRKTFNEAALAEFTENVRQHGILQPLLVRLWPAEYPWQGIMPLYEIVAGERRYRAAKAVGLTFVPVLCKQLTTRDVVAFQVIENLQREDLHPLEEAAGYSLMMNDHGFTAEQLAEKIGKSRSYIFGRLKLLDLDADSRRLFSGGILNASTALLVARIPTAALRAKAIKEITEKDYNGDIKSVRQAQRWIQDRFMLKLADATFSRKDSTLKGGACTTCPKRTGNLRDLFEDIKSPDVCTDPDCFGAKKLEALERDIAKAKEAGAQVIAGKEAKKLAPHGISDYESVNGYTKIDKKCYEDSKQRTYREIFGDAVEVVLIEDVAHDRLVPVIKNSVLADKLQEAGIQSHEAKADKEKAKLAEKLKLERAYRDRLFLNVRTEIVNYTLDGVPTVPEAIATAILRRVVGQLFERLYGDVQSKVATLWQAEGKNATERNKNFLAKTAPGLNGGECWQALVDLVTIGSVGVSEWLLDTEPKALLDMAALFALDPAEVRKDVVFEAKEQKKAAKPAKSPATTAKKTNNPAPVPTGEAPDAAEAARAGESLRAEGAFAVGDRVRIRMDIDGTTAWKKKVCGREGVIESTTGEGAYLNIRIAPGKAGLVSELVWNELDKLPPPTEAAQAGDEVPGDPIPADAGIIETNETPINAGSVMWIPKKGDLVRTKNGKSWTGGPLQFDIEITNVDLETQTAFCRETGPVVQRTNKKGKTITEKPSVETVYTFDDLLPLTVPIETNETPIESDAGAGTGEAAAIETNEKPTGARPNQVTYCHPDDAALTWSGRGRRPAWLVTWLASGQTLEALREAA